jgi:hypothetical protein
VVAAWPHHIDFAPLIGTIALQGAPPVPSTCQYFLIWMVMSVAVHPCVVGAPAAVSNCHQPRVTVFAAAAWNIEPPISGAFVGSCGVSTNLYCESLPCEFFA